MLTISKGTQLLSLNHIQFASIQIQQFKDNLSNVAAVNNASNNTSNNTSK